MTLSAGSILCFPHKGETRKEVNSCLRGVSSVKRRTVCREPFTSRITGPQNGRGWKGPLWVTQSNPPAEAGSPRAGCTGPCPGRVWISPEKQTSEHFPLGMGIYGGSTYSSSSALKEGHPLAPMSSLKPPSLTKPLKNKLQKKKSYYKTLSKVNYSNSFQYLE